MWNAIGATAATASLPHCIWGRMDQAKLAGVTLPVGTVSFATTKHVFAVVGGFTGSIPGLPYVGDLPWKSSQNCHPHCCHVSEAHPYQFVWAALVKCC